MSSNLADSLDQVISDVRHRRLLNNGHQVADRGVHGRTLQATGMEFPERRVQFQFVHRESYSKPHLIEKKNNARAASNASRYVV
jgi:hypothetical protein